MAINLYYDTNANRFVYSTSGSPLAIKDYPTIFYRDSIVINWNIGYFDADTATWTAQDLTELGAITWQSAIDLDFDDATDVMCRTLDANIDDSDAVNGVVSVTYDANTESFLDAVDGQTGGLRVVYCELKAYVDATKVFTASPIVAQIRARAEIDPAGGTPPDPVGDYYTKTESDSRYVKLIFSETATLTDNTTNAINLGLSSSYRAIQIKGAITNSSNTPNVIEGWIYHNGTNAYTNCILVDFNGSNLTGITFPFTADISGGQLRLKIALSSAGENYTLTYNISNYISI